MDAVKTIAEWIGYYVLAVLGALLLGALLGAIGESLSRRREDRDPDGPVTPIRRRAR